MVKSLHFRSQLLFFFFFFDKENMVSTKNISPNFDAKEIIKNRKLKGESSTDNIKFFNNECKLLLENL